MTTTEAFVGKVLGDTTGLTNTVLAWIGDELGLWKDLHARPCDERPAGGEDPSRREARP